MNDRSKKVLLHALVLSMFVLGALACLGQEPAENSAADAAELPDIPALFKEVEKHARESEAIQRNYVFRRVDEVQELDKKGQVKSTETMEYDVRFESGEMIQRLVAKNGKPLSESERKKQDKAVAKQEKRARELAADPEKREKEENSITPSKFIAAERFYNVRREMLNGREMLAFDLEPRPEYKGKGLVGKFMKVMVGTIWIDENAKEMVKLHLRLRDGMSLGLGLASVKEGAYMTFENARVNDEIWLPSAGEANFGFRVIFSRKNIRVKFRFSDYRKFGSESRITAVEEMKQ